MKKTMIAALLAALVVSASVTAMAGPTFGNTCGQNLDGSCSTPGQACQWYYVWGWTSWTTNGNCTTITGVTSFCCACE